MVRAPDPSDTARRRLEALSPATASDTGAAPGWTPQRVAGTEPVPAVLRADELRTPTSPVPRVAPAAADDLGLAESAVRPRWPELRVADGPDPHRVRATAEPDPAGGHLVPGAGSSAHVGGVATDLRPTAGGTEVTSGVRTPPATWPFGDGGDVDVDAQEIVRRVATGPLARARDEYTDRYGSPLEREHEATAAASARRWAVPTRLGLVAALAVALVAGVVVARAASVLVPQVGTAVELPEVAGAPGTGGDEDGARAEPDAGTGDDPTGAPTAAARPAEPAGQVVVHVVGQVAQPGIVTLPEGARVSDALTAVGGPSPSADLAVLNLARVLVDGEQVAVSAVGDAAAPALPGPGADTAGGGGPLDLNTADAAALDELPGIGPVLAGRIVAWREEHGRFRSVDELADVEGIGPALLERLTPAVRV